MNETDLVDKMTQERHTKVTKQKTSGDVDEPKC